MQSMNVKNITVSWLTNLNNCNVKVNEKLKKKNCLLRYLFYLKKRK